MQICSDPLRKVRTVRPDELWSVTIPAGYPTIYPYRPNNVERHGEENLCIDPTNIDDTKFDRTAMKVPSMYADNQLIQRLQQGIEQRQTSLGKNTHQNDVGSFGPVKGRASNGNGREQINHTHRNKSSTSRSVPMDLKSTSSSQHDGDQTSAHHSHLSNGPIYSTGSQSYMSTTSDRSSQYSITPSTTSSLVEDRDYSNRTASNSTLSSNPTNDTDDSSVMSIPVPLSFSKAHTAKNQTPTDQLHNTIHSPSQFSGRQLNDDDLLSATKMSRSPSLSPSEDEQQIDSRSSSSSALSSNSNISHSTQQDLSTISSISSTKSEDDDQSRSSPTASHQIIANKLSGSTRENSHSTSSYESSSNHISPTQTNQRKKLKDHDQTHMKEAMTTLAFDLTEIARQALINKRNDTRQNRLIRLLTIPCRCCRTCRTQRRLASIAQRSINIAMNT